MPDRDRADRRTPHARARRTRAAIRARACRWSAGRSLRGPPEFGLVTQHPRAEASLAQLRVQLRCTLRGQVLRVDAEAVQPTALLERCQAAPSTILQRLDVARGLAACQAVW